MKAPAVGAAGSEKVQLVLENRRHVATRLASQITAHSGFGSRALSHIGIENIVKRWLRRGGASVKPRDVTRVELKAYKVRTTCAPGLFW